MATLKKTVSKIKAINFEDELLDILVNNEGFIIDKNTKSQLFDKGISSDGSQLPLPYAPFTISEKEKSGLPTDRITLFQTGDFHEGFYLDAGKFPVSFWSTDSKTSELVSDWGDDIFGLTNESQSDVNAHILLDVQNAYKKAIGL